MLEFLKVSGVVRLTSDAEVISTNSGTITKMRGVQNYVYKDASGNKQERANYVNLVYFNALHPAIADKLKKGRRISFSGSLRTGTYEKEDGTKVSFTDLVVEDICPHDDQKSTVPDETPIATPSKKAAPKKAAPAQKAIEVADYEEFIDDERLM